MHAHPSVIFGRRRMFLGDVVPRRGSPHAVAWEPVRRPCPRVVPRHIAREETIMCANCGCGIPEDKHGDDRNINWSEVVASAEANDISPEQAVQNMQEMARNQRS